MSSRPGAARHAHDRSARGDYPLGPSTDHSGGSPAAVSAQAQGSLFPRVGLSSDGVDVSDEIIGHTAANVRPQVFPTRGNQHASRYQSCDPARPEADLYGCLPASHARVITSVYDFRYVKAGRSEVWLTGLQACPIRNTRAFSS